MKALYFLFFILLSVASQLHAQEPICLTLNDTFSRVCNSNLTYQRQLALTESIHHDAKIKRADLFPQINIEATQFRSRAIANFGTAPFPFYTTRFDADLTGSLAVLDFRKIYDYRAAKRAYNIAQLQADKSLQDTLEQAARAFYLHNRNLDRLKVLNANIQRSKTLLELAQLSFQAGASSALDVTRAKVQLSVDQKAKLQHETQIVNSELSLKNLLNYPPDLCINLNLSCEQYLIEPQKYSCDYPLALQSRPDYLAALKQKELYQIESRAATLDLLPSLNASAKWGGASMHTFDGDTKQEWSIGATLSMPVFDGFRIRSKKHKAEALIRSQNATIQDLENTIANEVALNQQTLHSRYKQVKITEEQVDLAQEELELAQIRFKEGVADNADIVDAQANLAQFSDELVNITYLYNLARISWAASLGDLTLLLQNPETTQDENCTI